MFKSCTARLRRCLLCCCQPMQGLSLLPACAHRTILGALQKSLESDDVLRGAKVGAESEPSCASLIHAPALAAPHAQPCALLSAARLPLSRVHPTNPLQYWMADPVLVDKKSPGWSNYSQDQARERGGGRVGSIGDDGLLGWGAARWSCQPGGPKHIAPGPLLNRHRSSSPPRR